MQQNSASQRKGLARFGGKTLALMLLLPLAYVAWHTVGHAQEAAVLAPAPTVDSPAAVPGSEETAVLSMSSPTTTCRYCS